jgi:hypothetical protein
MLEGHAFSQHRTDEQVQAPASQETVARSADSFVRAIQRNEKTI